MNNTKEHNLIVKANRSPRSKQLAINAFCFHCMGGTLKEMPDYGVKELIRTCTAPDCPLFIHRPYQEKKADLTRLQKSIGEERRGDDIRGNHSDGKNQPADKEQPSTRQLTMW